MLRFPTIIFIFNLILFASCNDVDEPKKITKTPEIEEDLIEENLNIEAGSKINGQNLILNAENSEVVDFGDMYEIKLKLDPQPEHRTESYEIRLYIVRSGAPGVQKYSIQNFSPSRKQISIGLSCIAEITYKDTLYYGYEGSVNLVNHQNGKMDVMVQVKAESLKGLPLELLGGIFDLQINSFDSQDCYVDKVISQMTYTGNTLIARYFYTSEGKVKYVHFGSESAGEAYYFSYLNGNVKEFWHSMTLQDGMHKVTTTGIVHINSSKKIESIDFTHSNNPSPVVRYEVQTFFYNEMGQLNKHESRFAGDSDPRTTEYTYSGKNVTEQVSVSWTGTSTLNLGNYDNQLGPSRRIHNRVHENFFYISLFKFDGAYFSLSENNFGYRRSIDPWGHIEEANYTYAYDNLGNTVEIKWNNFKGYRILYKYCDL